MEKQNEIIRSVSSKKLFHYVLYTQLFLFLLSLLIGIILYDSFDAFLVILKVEPLYITAGALIGAAIVIADLFLMRMLPDHYYNDGGVNEKLFGSLNPFKIALLALCIATAEELLFRGVIQANSNLVIASLLFAVIHFRYLNHWYLTLNIFVLSFVIGAVFEWSNSLWTTIALHFIVDFLLGLYLLKKSKQLK
ncbi:CPBP family intramembrane glutamic endopeptidase [Jeotgalibacillus sp. S-D1]|uniref:CPBP family intramembrane glutamic endopeptidase n=1 Tax=Jeotgalibacillus sp. S-D1 TaxID=2552189 RepID=UPI0014046F8C|nr:CPBP family intramembrane glutamic endopeptidase [Jeotgalibacillus sp. S-D1]